MLVEFQIIIIIIFFDNNNKLSCHSLLLVSTALVILKKVLFVCKLLKIILFDSNRQIILLCICQIYLLMDSSDTVQY